MEAEKSWETGMLGYDDALKAIVAAHPDAKILELGADKAGKWTSPMFHELLKLGIHPSDDTGMKTFGDVPWGTRGRS